METSESGRCYKVCTCDFIDDCLVDYVSGWACTMVEAAADAGCLLVVLPEMFNCPYENSHQPAGLPGFSGKGTDGIPPGRAGG